MQSLSFLYVSGPVQFTRGLQQIENHHVGLVDHPGPEPVCLKVFSQQNAFSIYGAYHFIFFNAHKWLVIIVIQI